MIRLTCGSGLLITEQYVLGYGAAVRPPLHTARGDRCRRESTMGAGFGRRRIQWNA